MNKAKAFFLLSKPHQHTQGLLPFLLGTVLSWKLTGSFNLAVFLWSIAGAFLIMLLANYAGEYFDFETDTLAKNCRNRFSGGSQVFQTTTALPLKTALWATYICLGLAAAVGIILQFYYKTGPLTIPLGAMGIIAGFFYSHKPVQWAYIGLGEVWIWFAYGWLSVVSGFYLQAGHIPLLVHLISLPAAFTVFNVIVINEFPDYEADIQVGKRNLVVRFGKETMAKVYCGASAAAWISLWLCCYAGMPSLILLFELPIFILCFTTTYDVLMGRHSVSHRALEMTCLKTLMCNCGIILTLIISYLIL